MVRCTFSVLSYVKVLFLCVILSTTVHFSLVQAQDGVDQSILGPCGGINAWSSDYEQLRDWGRKLLEDKKLKEAEVCFKLAVEQQPRYAGSWGDLEQVYKEMGLLQKALECGEKATELAPNAWALWVNLGNTYKELKRYSKAEACYKTAIKLKPDSTAAINNLGILYYNMGKVTKAYEMFQKALEFDNQSADSYYNIANIMKDHGKFGDALSRYRAALQYNPKMKNAYVNMGIIYDEQGRYERAIDSYERALELQPDYADALFNMGSVYFKQKQYQRALDYLARALKINPNLTDAYSMIARVRVRMDDEGDEEAAIELFEKALFHMPTKPKDKHAVFDDYVFTRLNAFLWSDYHANLRRLTANHDIFAKTLGTSKYVDRGFPLHPFHALMYDISDQVVKNTSASFAKVMETKIQNLDIESFENSAGYPEELIGNKLRVGFLSENFNDGHPVIELTRGLFRLHDPEQIEIFCFALPSPGRLATGLESSVEQVVDLSKLPIEQAVERINSLRIHILVHLDGHSPLSSSLVSNLIVALQPAPIQISFLGFLGSLGLAGVRGIITDHVASPQDKIEQLHNEKAIYMPTTFIPNDYRRIYSQAQGDAIATRHPDVEQGKVVLCTAYAYGAQVDPTIFGTWMNILRRAPNTVLWMVDTSRRPTANSNSSSSSSSNPQQQRVARHDRIRMEAAARGVDPARISFFNEATGAALHARLRAAHVYLDTLHYQDPTIALDVMWSGIQAITLPSDRMSSRVTASAANAMMSKEGGGYPKVRVVSSLQEYEDAAVFLATASSHQQQHQQQQHTDEEQRSEDESGGSKAPPPAAADMRSTAKLWATEEWVEHFQRAMKLLWESYKANKSQSCVNHLEVEPRHTVMTTAAAAAATTTTTTRTANTKPEEKEEEE